MSLEQFVVSHEQAQHDPIDVAFVGHVLFALYTRSRWTDSLYASQIILDLDEDENGYVQANTLKSKTFTSIQKKTPNECNEC